MKNIKCIIMLILAIVLSTALFSCGEYSNAVGGGEGGGGAAVQPDLDNDPANDFTVSLRCNGQAFKPETAVNVYWNDGYSINIAPIGEDGIARIDGLDGDYKVTLSQAPSGYAYNPNGYVATNDDKHVVIDLYDLNVIMGQGESLYSCFSFDKTGVYSVTVTDPTKAVYFEFAPQKSGTYTIESWVDVVDDNTNPICIAYKGGSHYKFDPKEIDDGGVSGSYTRNFVHTVEIADEMISSGGSQTFTFAVTAETKNNAYPVTVTFAVKRDGGFDIEHMDKSFILPTHDFSDFDFAAFEALAGGNLVGAETVIPGTDGYLMFNEDNYKVGKDGVYHVYDPIKYADTDGYGPILVAYITEACRFVDRSFTTIEDVGNNALTVDGTDNYKLFIEGYESMADKGYFCSTQCPCHQDGSMKVCYESCTTCDNLCNPCPDEYRNIVPYSHRTNSDGVAPVTEELARFLQRFAITQRYFADGEGWVETGAKPPVDAYEDSQWLFACGYYAD